MSLLWGDASSPSAKMRTAYTNSWHCTISIIVSVCPMPASACRCHSPCRPTDGLRQDVAAADSSDGRGADGAGVDPPGGVALSRAAVAATSGGVSKQEGGKRHGKRA